MYLWSSLQSSSSRPTVNVADYIVIICNYTWNEKHDIDTLQQVLPLASFIPIYGLAFCKASAWQMALRLLRTFMLLQGSGSKTIVAKQGTCCSNLCMWQHKTTHHYVIAIGFKTISELQHFYQAKQQHVLSQSNNSNPSSMQVQSAQLSWLQPEHQKRLHGLWAKLKLVTVHPNCRVLIGTCLVFINLTLATLVWGTKKSLFKLARSCEVSKQQQPAITKNDVHKAHKESNWLLWIFFDTGNLN